MTARNKNIPSLRFKEFTENWKSTKLGEQGTTNGGLTYSPSDVVEDSSKGTLVLRSSNVQNGIMTFDDNVYVSCPITDKDLVQENDILLCVRNGSKHLIGKSLIIKKEHVGFAFGAFMAIYRSKSNLFIYHFFKSPRFYKQVHEHLGATINQITGKSLNSFKLNLPTLPEQQKIASFLFAIDEKIWQLTRRKELLEQYKKGVMQQLFSGKLRFKDEQGKGYPKWEEKRLGDITDISTGSSNRQDSGLDGMFTFFDRSQDIRTSSIYLFDGEAVIVAGEGQEFIPKYFVGKFDLHQRTYAIMNFNNLIGKYLFYYIFFHRNYFLSQAVGSTVKSLRLPMFQNMNVKVPHISEQQKIASFLSSIDTKIESVTAQIEGTKGYKKGLLQQMFV